MRSFCNTAFLLGGYKALQHVISRLQMQSQVPADCLLVQAVMTGSIKLPRASSAAKPVGTFSSPIQYSTTQPDVLLQHGKHKTWGVTC